MSLELAASMCSLLSLPLILDSRGTLASTIYSNLLEKIPVKNLVLRWVRHTQTGHWWERRVEAAGQLLRMLESQEKSAFHDIVTREESSFLALRSSALMVRIG
jgi:hypothetical protein